MTERAEPGDVPDLAVGLVVEIGIQLVLVKQATAASAKVAVVTQAMDNHHLARKSGVRVKALTLPWLASESPRSVQR
jgi:hypothetical protein